MEEKVSKVEIVDDKRSGLATASMVLGIIAVIGCWVPFLNIFSIIMAVIGLGLGIPALIVYLKKKKGSLGKTIAGLVLCLITVIIGISMNISAGKAVDNALDELNGDKTQEILQNEIEVTFGKYVTDGNEYYETGKLEVTIKNKTNESQSYTVNVEALDNDGVRISTSAILVSNLAAGQSVKEDAFTFDNVEKLKTAASFKVYEVNKF